MCEADLGGGVDGRMSNASLVSALVYHPQNKVEHWTPSHTLQEVVLQRSSSVLARSKQPQRA